MSLRQLERDWRDTGLRRFDLQLALKDLVQRQWLTALTLDDAPHYELTYLGECATHEAFSGGPVTMVNDWLTLRHAKHRVLHQAPTPAAARNRRAGDRKPARPETGPVFDAPHLHSH